MSHRGLCAMALFTVAGLGITSLNAGDVEIESSKDNTLYEFPGGVLSNGAGDHMFCGTVLDGTIRRGLVAFDIASHVPAGAVIDSVSLRLNMSRTIVSAFPCSLHRVSQDWGEGDSHAGGQEGGGAPSAPGDATWAHTFFDTGFWTTDGGDFEAASSATILVDAEGSYTFAAAAMAADVQGWLDDPSSAFGWAIIGDESTQPTAKRWDTHENSVAANRPVLTVTYSIVGDINGDDIVDTTDLLALLAAWGDCPGKPDPCDADINNDTVVDTQDLLLMLGNWTV